nr:hypothetical protein [Leisingera sp. HS039]
MKDAVRISSPLIAMMAIGFAMGDGGTFAGETFDPAAGQSQNLLLQFLTGMAGLWVAVAWHRFVLLEEQGGLVPAFHGRRMLSYFFVLLLLTLMMTIAGGTAGGLVGILSGASGPIFIIGIVGIVAVAVWGFYRLSPLLPAAALGQALGARSAWQATSEISGAVFLAAILLIFFFLLGAAAALLILFQVSAVVGLVMLGVLQWVWTMAGISILTTIYGIAIERRPI